MSDLHKEIVTFSDEKDAPYASLVISWGEGIHGGPLIGNVWVDSSYRKMGIGFKLLSKTFEIIQNSRERWSSNCAFAVVHPDNEASRALFRKAGYSEMILMEKKFR